MMTERFLLDIWGGWCVKIYSHKKDETPNRLLSSLKMYFLERFFRKSQVLKFLFNLIQL